MKFADVIGQYGVRDRLISSSCEGRVSHALLFFGPPGSGVLPMARAFAQYLNCEQPGDKDSCGRCGSCLRSGKMVHPDIHYVYPVVTATKLAKPVSQDYLSQWRELVLPNPYLDLTTWVDYLTGGESKTKQGAILAEEAGEIVRKISLKAYEGRYKIILIWMPEKMNASTANKLLKSLEEPPDDTVFILASEARDQLLATILSRTQLVKLGRLQEDEIAAALLQRFPGLSSEEAAEIALMSDGCMGEALAMALEDRGQGSREQDFLNWMRLCFNPLKSMEKLLAWIEGMAAMSREQQKQFLVLCTRMVRECLLLNMNAGSLVHLDSAQKAALDRFRQYIRPDNVDQLVEILNKGLIHVERNAHSKILFLDLSLKVSQSLAQK